MASLDTLKDKARKFLGVGKLEKAAEAYRQLSEHEPNNARWVHKLGELHQRMQNEEDALASFERAAVLYSEQGFLLKGIALCRQILSMDSEHERTQVMLSALVERKRGPRAARKGASAPPPTPISMPVDPSMRELEVSTDDAIPEIEAIDIDVAEPEQAPAAAEEEIHIEMEAPVGAAPEATEVLEISLELGQTLDSIRLSDVFDADERAELEATVDPKPSPGVFAVDLDEADVEAAFQALADEEPLEEEWEEEGVSLLDKVRPTPLFGALEPAALRSLIADLEVRFYDKDDVIIKQGAEGDNLYVLVEGEVAVYREGPPRMDVAQLEEGAFFGEIALLTQRKRTATVETLDECTVLELSRAAVGRLITKYPSALKVMLRFFRERLVDTLVDTHALFAPFGGSEREALARRFSFVEVMPGKELAKEGERVEGLYLVLSGKLEGSTEAGSSFELDTGDVFGETSLLAGSPAPFSVQSKGRAWLLMLDDEVFREVIMTHPQVLEVVTGLSEQHAEERRLAADTQLPVL